MKVKTIPVSRIIFSPLKCYVLVVEYFIIDKNSLKLYHNQFEIVNLLIWIGNSSGTITGEGTNPEVTNQSASVKIHFSGLPINYNHLNWTGLNRIVQIRYSMTLALKFSVDRTIFDNGLPSQKKTLLSFLKKTSNTLN